MSAARPPTVHVPSADYTPVFHTSPRCRHCPPGSRTLSRAAAHEAGFTECETCYEERADATGIPVTLLYTPRSPAPASSVRHADLGEQ